MLYVLPRKQHNEETKRKISETHRKLGTYEKASKRLKENNPRKYRKYKKVAMISTTTNEILDIFENATAAGNKMKELGLTSAKHPSNIITGVCNGYEPSACGYFWKYVD